MNVAGVHWRALDAPARAVFTPRLCALLDAAFPAHADDAWKALQAAYESPTYPVSLVHGDFHAQNMFVRRSTGAVVLVDWSVVGRGDPLLDIAQVFISDVAPDVRRACERAVLGAYYEALVRAGVSAEEFSWQLCWAAYGAAYSRWLWMLPLLHMFQLPPEPMAYFVRQVDCFVADHATGDDAATAPLRLY